jgi:pyruvate dehydrogenase E1 component alpha subunit
VSYRFATHSTATRETRDPAELATWRARCPIRALAAQLPAELYADCEREVAETVEAALRFAEASPFPDPADLLDDVG